MLKDQCFRFGVGDRHVNLGDVADESFGFFAVEILAKIAG
ncbi:Uncharacterised protein [Vibrio cholerae]|nr:Uncharacterised protein [Vibrio cholerae]